ncbi:MAG: carboxypeptidase regulatory-like domain-containing protein [Planctomycetes bacterium]|nr:carboxypeptidase regulatory-like domain-containing protein [Planctomycetota bacterium]
MRYTPKAVHVLARLLVMASVAFAALAPSRAFGQETPAPLEVEVKASPIPLAVNLRPNVATSVALSLFNSGPEELRGVVVKLVNVDDDEVLGQTTEVDKLPSKGKVRVAFPKAKKKTPEKKEKAAKIDAPGLSGPPFKLQVWIEAKQPKEFVTVKRNLVLVLKQPRDYMTAQAHFDRFKRRISCKVKFGDAENATGPHKCKVQLVPGPEFKETKKGTFSQFLIGPKQAVDLFAEDVAFTRPMIRLGRASLTVDGYERAFIYPIGLTGSGDLDEVPFGPKIGARMRVPRFGKADEKFKVALEMDGPLGPDYRVEIGLDRTGKKEQFVEVQKFTGLREQKIALRFSPAGNFVCKTEVNDWHPEFNTTGIFGHLWFRVAVYKKDQQMALSIPEEVRPELADQEPGVESKSLFARVTQDETPPMGVEFVNLPRNWLTGKPLPIVVRVKLREDHQAPLDTKVLFFKGKAPPDGKIDPESILGIGEYDPDKGTCSILLPAPEKEDVLQISVKVQTRAGVPALKSAVINIKDRKSALATIMGTVAHGKNGQPKLTVTLSDEKGKPKATAKTNAKGQFVFEDVAPGNYIISAKLGFPALVGATRVPVPVGTELIENVTVQLLAK